MKKLKIILLCSIVLITLIYCFISIKMPAKSKYNLSDNTFMGIVDKLTINKDKTTIILKGEEKLLVNYYKQVGNIKLGDKIKVIGSLSLPNNNDNFNLFNYQKYLLSLKINYVVSANYIEVIEENKNILYVVKNKIIERIGENAYLKAFILGDNSNISNDIKKSYQINGVSHLFAVSGMHVSFLSTILLFFINKLTKKYNKLILILLLLFYCFLVNFSPSIMRSVLFLILINIKNKLKINISTFNLFIILTCMFLIYNSCYIYHMGFLYSFITSGFLIFFKNKIIEKNYFKSLFKISLFAFFASLPINIYYNFEINLLSPLLNLIFVPLISFIVFPISFLVFVFPTLSGTYIFLINMLENMSLFLSNINIFNIIFAKPHFIVLILYYLIIIIVIKNRRYIFILTIVLFVHNNIRLINKYSIVTMLDVGQGDSILIDLPSNKGNILIDTGGNLLSNNYISNNITIPYLKSVGIKGLNYLIITHGDYDHMGEAINLVNDFKVEKVIFNCGEFNDLEKELIEVLDKKKIQYYSCIKELNIGDDKLYFLNNVDYGNKNDNSSVIYTELNNHKFLFMGDAGVEVEEALIEKYDLEDIDVLKVGHHGSKTSSSKKFIAEVDPKYSIISVGKNNMYGHPNGSVLEALEDSQIYRTDQDGSVMFKIKNNKLKIETCTP